MNKILSRFYFFSKSTTSLILFITLLFLGYLFSRAYLENTNNTDTVSVLTEELIILSNSVEKNSINLEHIRKIISQNENLLNEFNSVISEINKHKTNEYDLLRDEISNLSKKIHSSNN